MSVVNFFSRERGDFPQDDVGIGGFILKANVSETSAFTSTVPVSHLEDGSEASDHIILNPTTLSITGRVSEIIRQDSKFDKLLKRAENTVAVIGIYLPAKNVAQIQKGNALISDVADKISEINRMIDDGEQIATFAGLTNPADSSKSIPEAFLDTMESLHLGLQLVSINMPFRIYSNMRIDSCSLTRTNKSNALLYDIAATQVRFVETQSIAVIHVKNPTNNLKGQTENKSNEGTQTGDEVPAEKEQSIIDKAWRSR